MTRVFFAAAMQNRRTQSTKFNLTSSRSHAVVKLQLVMNSGDTPTFAGQLFLIDLAGSEGFQVSCILLFFTLCSLTQRPLTASLLND